MPRNRPLNIKIGKGNSNHNPVKPVVIIRKLKQHDNLRKIFLEIAKKEPCIVSEILVEHPNIDKHSAYKTIAILVKFGIVEKIKVSEAFKKKKKTWAEKKLIAKFNDWTSKMFKKLKEYYFYRTHYQIITEYGEQFIKLCCEKENVEFEVKK